MTLPGDAPHSDMLVNVNNQLGWGSMICGICQLLCFKYSHHGQFQGTQRRSLEQGREEMLSSSPLHSVPPSDTTDLSTLESIDQSKIVGKWGVLSIYYLCF